MLFFLFELLTSEPDFAFQIDGEMQRGEDEKQAKSWRTKLATLSPKRVSMSRRLSVQKKLSKERK